MATKRAKGRLGQAFVELAIGMFALSLVLSALLGYVVYIARAGEFRRDLRAKAGRAALTSVGSSYMNSFTSISEEDVVEVEPFAAEYIFGTEEVEIREEVHLPAMGVAP